jgi:hypothetical protein
MPDATEKVLHQQRVRMMDILRRHVHAEDVILTDRDFIKKIFERWEDALLDALIDPAE